VKQRTRYRRLGDDVLECVRDPPLFEDGYRAGPDTHTRSGHGYEVASLLKDVDLDVRIGLECHGEREAADSAATVDRSQSVSTSFLGGTS
jgi:hypothetical protein